jgi:hypothetical protein
MVEYLTNMLKFDLLHCTRSGGRKNGGSKQAREQGREGERKQKCGAHTMIYYSIFKKTEIIPFATT